MDTTGYSAFVKTLRAVDDLGATIPKSVRDAHTDLEAFIEQTTAFRADLRADPAAAALAALEAGKDPYTDPDVHYAVVAAVIKQNTGAFTAAVEKRKTEFIEAAAPAVLPALSKPFDQAAAVIMNAAKDFGDLDMDDHDAVSRRGAVAGEAWAEVHIAEDRIADVINAWRALCGGAKKTVAGPSLRFIVLAIADVPPADFIDHNLERQKIERHNTSKLRAWDLARRGWPLSLATPEELQVRIAAVLEERARRDRGERVDPRRQAIAS